MFRIIIRMFEIVGGVLIWIISWVYCIVFWVVVGSLLLVILPIPYLWDIYQRMSEETTEARI